MAVAAFAPRPALRAEIVELLLVPETPLDVAGVAPTPVRDHQAYRVRPANGVDSAALLAGVPEHVGIAALDLADGSLLFALEGPADVAGFGHVEPRDVLRQSGGGYVLAIDGSAAGIPDGAHIDAVKRIGVNDYLLSFDGTVELFPGPVLADDEDVVRLNGSAWSLVPFFSAIPDALDVDGLDRSPSADVWYLSFDGSGTIGAASFDDEDVVAYTASTGSWSLAYDASTAAAAWAANELDSLVVLPSAIFSDGFELSNTTRWSATVPP